MLSLKNLTGNPNKGLDEAVCSWLDMHLTEVIATYRDIHSHPELAGRERRTSGILAARLRGTGATVKRGIGGFGVAAIVPNGPGPVILVRADMDALPISEETGLAYASRNAGVMHACGHDVHTTALAAAAAILGENKSLWQGTIVFIGQPSEETVSGAKAMVEDGLWKRVPRPDACLALHVDAEIAAGQISIVSGSFTANTDSVDVIIHGKGGHGASPHQAEDPIVAAAQAILALQTIVTRRVDPIQPVVITVGSIHAGQKHNIISDRAVLQLTVRTFSSGVRRQVLRTIRQVVTDTARAAGCSRRPEVKVGVEYTAALYNDPRLSEHARGVFRRVLGRGNVLTAEPTTGGEDFSVYINSLGVPGLLYGVGAASPKSIRRSRSGVPPVPLHNSRFAPVVEPTLRTSVRSMCALAGSLLGRQ